MTEIEPTFRDPRVGADGMVAHCPKCRHLLGCTPRYHRGADGVTFPTPYPFRSPIEPLPAIPEHIVWACDTCGATVARTATGDAK